MEDIPFSASFGDLVPERAIEHLGKIDLTFEGRLSTPLKISEDGGESGCGGKVWIAGELLCEYLLENSEKGQLLSKVFPGRKFTKLLELGSGTGLVGLCAGLMNRETVGNAMEVYISDIDQLMPLMQENISLNKLDDTVFAQVLYWGEQLPLTFEEKSADLILAADCVYLESAFPLLEKTLLDLTNEDKTPVILMAYKKRRKADKHFFQKIKKNFEVIEIQDFTLFEHYLKQRTHLFQLVRSKKK